MATVGRRRSITSSLGRSRDQSLAAPADGTLSKRGSASALSVGDGPGDAHDGALDRDDDRSDSSFNRRRLSGLFKRKKRRDDHASKDDVSQTDHAVDTTRPSPAPRNYSDDSLVLGLHRSVASSLVVTDESDSEP